MSRPEISKVYLYSNQSIAALVDPGCPIAYLRFILYPILLFPYEFYTA